MDDNKLSLYQVSDLVGHKSLRALNVYHTLLLGVKMLPAYIGESYEDFLSRLEGKTLEQKYKVFKEAALFVEIQKEELEALICFCKDKNGVPFQASNIKNLGPKELIDVIVSVCLEISKIKIDLVTEAEKKN